MTNQPWTVAEGVIVTPKSMEGIKFMVVRPSQKEAKEAIFKEINSYVRKNNKRANKVRYMRTLRLEAGPTHFNMPNIEYIERNLE